MSLPKAKVLHSSPGRIRIKVPEKRKDHPYFMALAEALSMMEEVESLEVNPLTGSALLTGGGLSLDRLVEFGAKEGLFLLEKQEETALTPAQAAVQPLKRLNEKVRSFVGNDVDLPTIGFLLLLTTGIYQLLRGNFRAPPWYTAFWYAFGVFSKELVSPSKDNK